MYEAVACWLESAYRNPDPARLTRPGTTLHPDFHIAIWFLDRQGLPEFFHLKCVSPLVECDESDPLISVEG